MTAPAPAVQQPGIGAVSADQLNTYVQTVLNFAQLRTFPALANMSVYVLGGVSASDGLQGIFYYVSSGTYTDDGTTTIVPYGAIQGAWLKESSATYSQTSVVNIAALRAITTGPFSVVVVDGYYTIGDGGGGTFVYDPNDTTTADNSGTIIVDAKGRRYYRLTESAEYNVRWFGAYGNGNNDDTIAIQATLNAAGSDNTVIVPPGFYPLSQTLIGPYNLTMIAPGGPLNTQFTRTGNYGDTLFVNQGSVGSGAVIIEGIWFRQTPDFPIAGASSLTNLVTTGAHLHLVKGQNCVVYNCMFWRMVYGIHMDGCSISTIDNCWVQQVWDPLYPATQEGIASVFLDDTAANCEIIKIVDSYLIGNQSAPRSVTWTASDGSVTAVVNVNVGAQYLIYGTGVEDLLVEGCEIQGASVHNVYSLPRVSSSRNIGWRFVGNFFDGGGPLGSNLYLGSNNAASLTGLIVTGNTFNGETISYQHITAFSTGSVPAVVEYSITGNTFQASVGSGMQIVNATGGIIADNQIMGYNCRNASPGADFSYSAAIWMDTSPAYANVSGNNVGGAVNVGTPSGSFSYNGIVVTGALVGVTQSNNTYVDGYTIANGANHVISANAYQRVWVQEDISIGAVGEYLIGNGAGSLVATTGGYWVAPTTTPASTHFSIGYDGTNWRIYNNYGSSCHFQVRLA